MNQHRSRTVRRKFLTLTTAAGAVLLTGPRAFAQMQTPPQSPTPQPPRERPPRLEAALVEEFVRAGHGNLPRTQEMLGQAPGLLNATWD